MTGLMARIVKWCGNWRIAMGEEMEARLRHEFSWHPQATDEAEPESPDRQTLAHEMPDQDIYETESNDQER